VCYDVVCCDVQESKYTGNYNGQNQRHGHGVTIYPNGDTYKGEYKVGYRNGKGIYGYVFGMISFDIQL
jgi:MORN repeat